MIRRLLRLFPYVRSLEKRLEDQNAERASERYLVDSMNRYIDQLEVLKKHHDEEIAALRVERNELKQRLSGGCR